MCNSRANRKRKQLPSLQNKESPCPFEVTHDATYKELPTNESMRTSPIWPPGYSTDRRSGQFSTMSSHAQAVRPSSSSWPGQPGVFSCWPLKSNHLVISRIEHGIESSPVRRTVAVVATASAHTGDTYRARLGAGRIRRVTRRPIYLRALSRPSAPTPALGPNSPFGRAGRCPVVRQRPAGCAADLRIYRCRSEEHTSELQSPC